MSILILLSSCSNSAVSDKLLNSESLKSVTDSKRENLQWTLELEKTRLSEKIHTFDYISPTNKLNPDTFMAFEAGNERPAMFPQLNGFGSLDITDIDPSALAVVDKFCSSVIKNEECEQLFEENSVYSLVLFMHDTKNYDYNSNWWYVGKGYFEGGALEIPVRITNGRENLDLKIYLKEQQNTTSEKDDKKETSQVQTVSYKILDVEITDVDNINKVEEK